MENNKWEIKQVGGGQIADTGDYGDPMYMLTNGDVELVTKDELDTAGPDSTTGQTLYWLDQLGVKWEDWKLSNCEFEKHLLEQRVEALQQDCESWKLAVETQKNRIDAVKAIALIRIEERDKWKSVAEVLYEDLKHGFTQEALQEDLKMYEELKANNP